MDVTQTGYTIKIGNVLSRYCKTHSRRLKQISRATGIPSSTLHNWVCNGTPKNLPKAQVLADYMKITLTELLFDQKIQTQATFNQQTFSCQHEEVLKGQYEVILRRIKQP